MALIHVTAKKKKQRGKEKKNGLVCFFSWVLFLML